MPDPDRHPHLLLRREEVINPRRSSTRVIPKIIPDDVSGHARRLLEQLTENERLPSEEGYDPRSLLKLTVSSGTAVEKLGRDPWIKSNQPRKSRGCRHVCGRARPE